jgi:hypothetical protein
VSAVESFRDCDGGGIYLDDSRRGVVMHTARVLCMLTSGRCAAANRFRQVVLGAKGVGKTTLLSALQHAAVAVYASRKLTVVCYTPGRETPLDVICRECGLGVGGDGELRVHGRDQERVATVDNALASQDQYVFLVIDEVKNLFLGSQPHGDVVLSELVYLGDSRKGRVHVVMTGSSSVTRKLCFAKLDLASSEAAAYKWYVGLDMNCTKFQPVCIYPFLGRDFMGAARLMTAGGSDLWGSDLMRVFWMSSGVAGAMRELLGKRGVSADSWRSSLRGCTDADVDFLFCVMECMVVSVPEPVEEDEWLAAFSEWIPRGCSHGLGGPRLRAPAARPDF